MADIFNGMSAADPMAICNQLGGTDDIAAEELTGALMTLCRTVASLELRIARLEEEIADANQYLNAERNRARCLGNGEESQR